MNEQIPEGWKNLGELVGSRLTAVRISSNGVSIPKALFMKIGDPERCTIYYKDTLLWVHPSEHDDSAFKVDKSAKARCIRTKIAFRLLQQIIPEAREDEKYEYEPELQGKGAGVIIDLANPRK